MHIRREFTIIDPKTYINIISYLAEHYEIEIFVDFQKIIGLILEMTLNFIKNERNIISSTISAEDFYLLIVNSNLLVSESEISKVLKEKILRIALIYKAIYLFQIKRKNEKFVKGQAEDILEFFYKEAEELEELKIKFS